MNSSVFPQLKYLSIQPRISPRTDGVNYEPVEPIVVTDDEGRYQDTTATFCMGAREDNYYATERLTLRWPLPTSTAVSKEDFLELCYSQAEYFSAQCLHENHGCRISHFLISKRCGPDRIDTERYLIPQSYQEIVKLGKTPLAFGLKIKPWYA